jgi:hypothetical protein
LTAGQYGPGGASMMIMSAPVGVTFDMKSFIVQNYSATSCLMVTGFDDLGNAVNTITLKGFAGSHLYSLSETFAKPVVPKTRTKPAKFIRKLVKIRTYSLEN